MNQNKHCIRGSDLMTRRQVDRASFISPACTPRFLITYIDKSAVVALLVTILVGTAISYSDTVTVNNSGPTVASGVSVDDPVHLTVTGRLANRRWASILSDVNSSGKYVALDLSTCTMIGTNKAVTITDAVQ
ncbi:MAG: hypothetical protein LBJ41_06315 [Treponema sp.]|jgi:hypothetical protein|nr:hypothetical protein [Treponema sp.]